MALTFVVAIGLGAWVLWPYVAPRPAPTPTVELAAALPTATLTPPPTMTPTFEPATPEPSATPAVITHTVKAGETLGGIARFYGASIEDVLTLNNLTNANVVKVGQDLLIPVPAFQSGGPTPTATSLPQLPAPVIAEPADGQVFAAADVITLRWAEVSVPLPPDAYQVVVEDLTCMCGRRLTFVVPEPFFVMPAELAPMDQRPHVFNWSVVTVWSLPVAEGDPPVYSPAGPASAIRAFIWNGP